MEFLKRHYEKVVLGVFLVGLLAWSWTLLGSLNEARDWVNDVKQNSERIDFTGRLDPVDGSELNALEVLNSEQRVWKIQDDPVYGNLFHPGQIIRCRSGECSYLLPYPTDVCPFCGAKQGPKGAIGEGDAPVENDTDGDFIPDDFEDDREFLDSNVASDGERDFDRDWFSNLEEYRAGTALDDPGMHPPLATKLRVLGLRRIPFPIFFERLIRNDPEDPQTWDVVLAVKGKGRTRKKFVRIGDKVEGYTIADVEYRTKMVRNEKLGRDIETEVSEVTLEKPDEEPIVLVLGKRTHEKGRVVGFILLAYPAYPRRNPRYTVREDKPLRLRDRSGLMEIYEIQEIDEKEGVVILSPLEVPGVEDTEFTVQRLNPRTDFERRRQREDSEQRSEARRRSSRSRYRR